MSVQYVLPPSTSLTARSNRISADWSVRKGLAAFSLGDFTDKDTQIVRNVTNSTENGNINALYMFVCNQTSPFFGFLISVYPLFPLIRLVVILDLIIYPFPHVFKHVRLKKGQKTCMLLSLLHAQWISLLYDLQTIYSYHVCWEESISIQENNIINHLWVQGTKLENQKEMLHTVLQHWLSDVAKTRNVSI